MSLRPSKEETLSRYSRVYEKKNSLRIFYSVRQLKEGVNNEVFFFSFFFLLLLPVLFPKLTEKGKIERFFNGFHEVLPHWHLTTLFEKQQVVLISCWSLSFV